MSCSHLLNSCLPCGATSCAHASDLSGACRTILFSPSRFLLSRGATSCANACNVFGACRTTSCAHASELLGACCTNPGSHPCVLCAQRSSHWGSREQSVCPKSLIVCAQGPLPLRSRTFHVLKEHFCCSRDTFYAQGTTVCAQGIFSWAWGPFLGLKGPLLRAHFRSLQVGACSYGMTLDGMFTLDHLSILNGTFCDHGPLFRAPRTLILLQGPLLTLKGPLMGLKGPIFGAHFRSVPAR